MNYYIFILNFYYLFEFNTPNNIEIMIDYQSIIDPPNPITSYK